MSNYRRIIEKQIKTGKIKIKGGEITDVFVRHDSWCNVFNGDPTCNCTPDITSSIRPDNIGGEG